MVCTMFQILIASMPAPTAAALALAAFLPKHAETFNAETFTPARSASPCPTRRSASSTSTSPGGAGRHGDALRRPITALPLTGVSCQRGCSSTPPESAPVPGRARSGGVKTENLYSDSLFPVLVR